MNKNTTKTSLASLAVAAAMACGNDTSMELGSRFLASAMVDASGGGFSVEDGSELDGLRLEVPAGAIADETLLGVAPSESLPVEDDIDWVGPAADFGPDGQQFEVPIRITLPLTESIGDREPVVRVVSADGTRELLAGTQVQVSQGFVSFEIDHFTRFQPGSRQRPAGGCTTDADCSQGDVCGPRGVCVTPAPECTTDGDCAPGEECSASQTCVPASTGCSADADCATNEVCVRTGGATGMCVVGDCTEDADCAQNEECSANLTCVAAPECRSDADCAQDETCTSSGTCAPAPECQTDRDCIMKQLGRICAPGGICV